MIKVQHRLRVFRTFNSKERDYSVIIQLKPVSLICRKFISSINAVLYENNQQQYRFCHVERYVHMVYNNKPFQNFVLIWTTSYLNGDFLVFFQNISISIKKTEGG